MRKICRKTAWNWKAVSLTNFNQTSKEHFNPNNAFDAEGLTKLTQETERRRRERNEVEQDVEVAVREKNRDALERKLEIEQQEAFMTLEQEQQVKTRTAEQNAKLPLLRPSAIVKQNRRAFLLSGRSRRRRSNVSKQYGPGKLSRA
ncbi:membrane protein [Salmonella enterica subsp. enterica]|nr:membrane protein [Salmonella enterica subsp. enterica] [Salmonella enterica subsp. enterica serovar Menston]